MDKPSMVTPDGDTLLWADDVAELAGVDKHTLRVYEVRARKARDAGKATIHHLPEPYDRQPREVPKAGGFVLITAPRYRRSQINVWLANRLGPGGRRATEQEAQ